MPAIRLSAYPVVPENVRMDAWWRYPALLPYCSANMCAIFGHSRACPFSLDRTHVDTFPHLAVCPFVALFALGVGFFFLWSYAGDEIEARLGAENITWKNVVRAGFPARMTMDFTEMGWQGENSTGRYPLCALPLCRLKPTMPLWIFRHRTGSPRILPNCALTMTAISPVLFWTHKGWCALSFTFTRRKCRSRQRKKPGLSGDDVALHVRRARDNAARTDIALRTGRIEGDARLGISRGELDIDTPQSWLTGSPVAGDLVGIDKFIIVRDALTFRGSGRLKLAASGFIDGKLDMDVVNLVALFELLEDAGLTRKRDRNRLMLLAQLSSAFSGKSRDRLQVPLRFRQARSFIGPLDVGPAPRWR